MKTKNHQEKTDINSRSIFSFVITLFGLFYLLLVLLGQVDKQSRRFQIPEVVVFTVVLILNSDTLQRLSKLSFGKEGISLELNEIKQSQDEIKQNQEKIQATQQEQRESITELKKIFEKFLDNNQPLVDMLKRASEVSLTEKFLSSKSSTSDAPEDTSENTSTTILASLLNFAATNTDVLNSLAAGLSKDQKSPEDETPTDQK
ncbi:hypothetical protein NIES2111_63660 (plasmid) [Nostoc sp. NIES-2111]|nr:hypothetical protein NIES2111_63660 [Nostoc sp. NIES-2111]